MDKTISLKRFAEIDLNDTFVDSLKEYYPGFETWFQKKSNIGRPAEKLPLLQLVHRAAERRFTV